jgi:hypothetical protein
MEVGGQRHAPAALPGTHCTGGWVGPGPVWTGAENLASAGIRSPDRPARSESLYLLSYPGPHYIYHVYYIHVSCTYLVLVDYYFRSEVCNTGQGIFLVIFCDFYIPIAVKGPVSWVNCTAGTSANLASSGSPSTVTLHSACTPLTVW